MFQGHAAQTVHAYKMRGDVAMYAAEAKPVSQ